MDGPREERFDVDFAVQLSWQVGTAVRRVAARCVNLSASGARLETRDPVPSGTTVLVYSELFGRMGLAVVKYCNRDALKHEIGISFGVSLQLSDPARRRILEGLIRTREVVEPVPEPVKVMLIKR